MTMIWTPLPGESVFAPVVTRKGRVEDHGDPSPLPAHIIYLTMAANFPPSAIQWVNRARWMGPVDIAWDAIDTDDIEKWAASKQPGRVKEFEQQIQAHKGNVKPSILVQEPGKQKAFIVDGHHRALARHNLKMPVLSYVGNIDPADRESAEETHTRQIHSGNDSRNA